MLQSLHTGMGPSGDTHVMQVGERSGLPRGGLLGTERIPKERHRWPDEGKTDAPFYCQKKSQIQMGQ